MSSKKSSHKSANAADAGFSKENINVKKPVVKAQKAEKANKPEAKPQAAESKPVVAKKKDNSYKRSLIGAIIAAVVLLGGAATAIIVPGVTKAPVVEEEEVEANDEPVEEPADPEEEKEEEPEEEEKPATNNTGGGGYTGGYQVAANMPRRISIPSLGIYANMVVVGKKGNAMDTPASEYTVGWYNQSVLPGQNGASVLTAHGGDLGNGIFKTLPRIQKGATITIEMGDGRTYTYRVVETARKAAGAEANAYMPNMFRPVEAGVPSLSLITCTGEWIRAQQAYTHRFFARAVLVQ